MKHLIYDIKEWLKPQRLLLIAMFIALLTRHGKTFIAILLIYFAIFTYDLFKNFHKYDAVYETAKDIATDIVVKNKRGKNGK